MQACRSGTQPPPWKLEPFTSFNSLSSTKEDLSVIMINVISRARFSPSTNGMSHLILIIRIQIFSELWSSRPACWNVKPTPWSCWRFRYLLEFSLICKLCSSLDVLIDLQRNILYSKPNQRATPFLRHSPHMKKQVLNEYDFWLFRLEERINNLGSPVDDWTVTS